MRRFIFVRDSDFYNATEGQERKLTLQMFDREDLVSFLDEMEILHIDGDEEAILWGINECNGDGDDHILLGEIIGNELKILVE